MVAAPISQEFVERLRPCAEPGREPLEAFCRWVAPSLAALGGRELDDRVDEILLTRECYGMMMPPVRRPVLSDEELASLGIPALYILGERDGVTDSPRKVLAHITSSSWGRCPALRVQRPNRCNRKEQLLYFLPDVHPAGAASAHLEGGFPFMRGRRMRTILLVLPLLCAVPSAVAAQDDELQVPAEVRPFVEDGTKAIAVESADLNGDSRGDYILVLERENPAKDENDVPVNQRPLLILVRGGNGRLAVAKRNERLVLCSQCGGFFGDPFEAVEVGRNTFTVHHYEQLALEVLLSVQLLAD